MKKTPDKRSAGKCAISTIKSTTKSNRLQGKFIGTPSGTAKPGVKRKKGEVNKMVQYQLYCTRRINDDVAENEEMAKAVYEAIARFNNNDYGEIPPEDIEANNKDLANQDGHILAKYPTPNGYIYINLQFNELINDDPEEYANAAMIMYPEEY